MNCEKATPGGLKENCSTYYDATYVLTPLCHLLSYLGEEKLCTHTHTFMKTYICMKLGDLSTALRALCGLERPPCSYGVSKQEIPFSDIVSHLVLWWLVRSSDITHPTSSSLPPAVKHIWLCLLAGETQTGAIFFTVRWKKSISIDDESCSLSDGHG